MSGGRTPTRPLRETSSAFQQDRFQAFATVLGVGLDPFGTAQERPQGHQRRRRVASTPVNSSA